MTNSNHLRVLVYSVPRSRSHMLFKLLGSHPAFATTQYPMELAFAAGPERQIAGEWLPSALNFPKEDAVGFTYQAKLDDFQNFIAKAESEGKIPITKEHMIFIIKPDILDADGYPKRHPLPVIADRMLDNIRERELGNGVEGKTEGVQIPNITVFPDRFFSTLCPLILIRHPARSLPSLYRASKGIALGVSDPDFRLFADSYKYQRQIFDSWKSAVRDDAEWPIVLDGDIIVCDIEKHMKKLCAKLKVDPALIQYSWKRTDQVVLAEGITAAYLKEIQSSTGVNKTPNAEKAPDIAEEFEKWTSEWDEETAKQLKSYVESSMKDYEYLLQFHM